MGKKEENKAEYADRVKEVKDKLKHGDLLSIAEMTAYSYEYVRRIFTGERNNADILQAAEMLVANREHLAKNLVDLKKPEHV